MLSRKLQTAGPLRSAGVTRAPCYARSVSRCRPVSKLRSWANRASASQRCWIRNENYPSICRKLWGGSFWSRRYFAGSCGGAPLPSSGNTSDNSKRRIDRPKDGQAVRAILPRPEGRCLPRTGSDPSLGALWDLVEAGCVRVCDRTVCGHKKSEATAIQQLTR